MSQEFTVVEVDPMGAFCDLLARGVEEGGGFEYHTPEDPYDLNGNIRVIPEQGNLIIEQCEEAAKLALIELDLGILAGILGVGLLMLTFYYGILKSSEDL